jgi:glucuronyl/N-acetylglucosaminyl transferase EXT2
VIEFGFQVWREFPDRIVGYPSRLHVWNQSSLSWAYESEWKNEHSMILTGAAFYNNYWSYVYTGGSQHRGLKEIRQWVDENMNCEDIAFNFMVSNTTNKPNIIIGPRKKFRCLTVECDNSGMLSQDLSHLARRSQCINKFTRVYGGMPLKSVEWRADPVLYKENLPPNIQVYSDIGSL